MVERKKKVIEEYGQRYNAWTYKTSKNGQEDEIAYQHPAIFPIQLVKDHIISWTNPGDLIYDPFMGSGTTAKAAIQTDRNFLGSEISEDYFKISLKRIE
jgi:site-specific DNA-methyltransferase (adenine-specific)